MDLSSINTGLDESFDLELKEKLEELKKNFDTIQVLRSKKQFLKKKKSVFKYKSSKIVPGSIRNR